MNFPSDNTDPPILNNYAPFDGSVLDDASAFNAVNVVGSGQSIGSILIDTGRLTAADADRILRRQKEENLLFGEAGILLGLLTKADVDFAIAMQFEYSFLQQGRSSISAEVVAAYEPFSPEVEAFRELRTNLLLRWFDLDTSRKTLSVVSADRGEGKSFLVANLAVVFSQLGKKTLVIDSDFRNARQHVLFGLSTRLGLSSILGGRSEADIIRPVQGIRNLFVLPAGSLPPNPQELLSQLRFRRLIHELQNHFDMVIVDTPAASQCSDALAVCMRTSASVAVVRKNHTRMGLVKNMVDSFSVAQCSMIGTVFNQF